MRILIAAADVTSRPMRQGALRKWGDDVVGAANGTEAWEAL
jgi:CheY-like chemotaxis protein